MGLLDEHVSRREWGYPDETGCSPPHSPGLGQEVDQNGCLNRGEISLDGSVWLYMRGTQRYAFVVAFLRSAVRFMICWVFYSGPRRNRNATAQHSWMRWSHMCQKAFSGNLFCRFSIQNCQSVSEQLFWTYKGPAHIRCSPSHRSQVLGLFW